MPRRTSFYFGLCSCVVLMIGGLLLLTPAASAQETITPGQTLTGTLAAGERIEWTFIAQDGQVLSFEASAADDSGLDPVLRLLDRNGNPLLENDDIDYPDNLNAAIEGVSAAGAGTYTLVLESYGDTEGAYEVSIQPGYSRVTEQIDFEETSGWQIASTAAETRPELTIRNGALTLAHSGISQTAIAIGSSTPEGRYYIQTRISDIDDSGGWRAGLVLRYRDGANHYQVLVNHRGAWQFARVANNSRSLIRDWTLHPAIVAGETEFTLGVLVNGDGYDIFYNGQFVGSVEDSSYLSGDAGLMLRTPDSVGNDVQVDFDSLTMTAPAYPDRLPQTLIAINSIYTARELERRGVIPAGGRLVLTLDESSTRYNEAGVSRVTVAGELQPRDFVLGARVSWNASADVLSGCGLVVRDTGEAGNYVLAYVDSRGGYGLALKQPAQFTDAFFDDVLATGAPPYDLLVIGAGNEIHYYLNRQYVGMLQTADLTGTIGEAVVNFETTSTDCRFDNLWLWQVLESDTP